MIDYNPGYWNILFVFSCRGSVFPRAIVWAIPSTILAVVINMWINPAPNLNVSQVWAGYNFVLGFLIVFRSQQAYRRFWEGATILQQVRGEWFNACSSCFAFCSQKFEDARRVETFQHTLIRLISLLYCAALQQVAILGDEAFEILDLDGFDEHKIQYLAETPEKTLVVLQWIQRLIINSSQDGVITAPPPILSRAFQELSRGIVNITNAQKITDINFPFPFAQMVSTMLMITTIISPWVTGSLVENPMVCGILNFVNVASFWSLNYIAVEIEMPFGDDENDLPIADLQTGMTIALRTLLDKRAQEPPDFLYNQEYHAHARTIKCPYILITDKQYSVFKNSQVLRAQRTLSLTHRDPGVMARALSNNSFSNGSLERPTDSSCAQSYSDLGQIAGIFQGKGAAAKGKLSPPSTQQVSPPVTPKGLPRQRTFPSYALAVAESASDENEGQASWCLDAQSRGDGQSRESSHSTAKLRQPSADSESTDMTLAFVAPSMPAPRLVPRSINDMTRISTGHSRSEADARPLDARSLGLPTTERKITIPDAKEMPRPSAEPKASDGHDPVHIPRSRIEP